MSLKYVARLTTYLDFKSLKIRRSGFNFKSNLTSAIGDLANCNILAGYYPLQLNGPTPFFLSKKFPPPEDPQNKSENYRPATRGIVTSLGEGIKGRPIHPLEEFCSGYPLIPYLAASDPCSGRCVNPAAKKSSVIFSPDYATCSHCAYPLSP